MPKLKYVNNVMTAFDFIESHLLDPDLSIKEAAKKAGFSEFHFSRIFCELVGESISDYLKARRLSQAAVELCSSSEAILVIALKYGFESQEAFTRAFKRLFGLNPGAYRKRHSPFVAGDLALGLKEPFSRALLEHINQRGFVVKPEIVTRKEEYAIGMGDSFKPKDTKSIQAHWDKFKPRMHEVACNGHYAFGICTNKSCGIEPKAEDHFIYVAALPVSAEAAVPPGMVKVKLEAGEYARFTHKGPVREIPRTVSYIWGQWQPDAPYKLRECPDFELCDERFNPDSDDSEFDIYVPLERR
ncbi:MAG: effector binding domain-containing protein [Candidatus Obscuribacter sp.]|nr:effector binding domain-containing protein [Candidatus Obscuribacter sp.]